MNTDKEKL